MLGLIALLLASQPAGIEHAIRDARSSYNAAISKHDLEAIEGTLAPDYVVLPGLTGTPLSRDGLLSLFATSFRDSSFITYVRTPERIAPSDSTKRVAESGRWAGTWKKPDGLMRVTGVYLAFWIPQGNGWTLLNESFVTLKCTGSRECASVE